MKKRSIVYDILRALAIVLIFLAHSNPPGIFFQLRNFDVILLIIVSGYFAKKSLDKNNSFKDYFIKRILRIVIPVWLFLLIYYLILFLVIKIPIDEIRLIDSFIFGEEFGYIWIFRVYLITIIIAPFLYFIYNKVKYKKFLVLLILSLLLNQLLVELLGTNNVYINWLVFYTLGYGVCFGLGFIVEELDKKDYMILVCFNLMAFVFLTIYFYLKYGKFITSNQFKYPPEIYYISYGLTLSLSLFYFFYKTKCGNKFNKIKCNILTFVGSHTMWIYLWHIPIIKILNLWHFDNWILKFIVLLVFPIIITKIQSLIIKKTKNNMLIKYLDC